MKTKFYLALFLCLSFFSFTETYACTGITLRTQDNLTVLARTVEWANEDINSRYVIVPRGHIQQSYTPDGKKNGIKFAAKHGYVGLAVTQDEFVIDGINEKGLSAGLFYFPEYGEYETYDSTKHATTIGDMQLVAYLLANCATIDQVKYHLSLLHIVQIDPRASTAHWRITEPSGRQIVLEVINQQLHFYENTLGVLTNAPDFQWHMTNLNNYTNLHFGTVKYNDIKQLHLQAIGGGNGLHGLPGDMTPPSRFIRAAFYQISAPEMPTTTQTVTQAFHILNTFDIPIGIQHNSQENIPNIPSGTQWTIAIDMHNQILYFRTMYNANIRRIQLQDIDFASIPFTSQLLDPTRQQPFEDIDFEW